MIIDNSLVEMIAKARRAKNDQERALHEPSGKLSGGYLPKPLQCQILKYLGIPGKFKDDYTLGLFERGKQVEEKIVEDYIKTFPCFVDYQQTVFYRDTIGIVDTLLDTKYFNYKVGIIPYEIKSVKGSKFKWILKTNEPDDQYCLQACHNALAENRKHFAILLIASDDLRMIPFTEETAKYKAKVDAIIDAFNAQVERKVIPTFEPRYSWDVGSKYSDYPEWELLTSQQIVEKMKAEYPENYKKFIS